MFDFFLVANPFIIHDGRKKVWEKKYVQDGKNFQSDELVDWCKKSLIQQDFPRFLGFQFEVEIVAPNNPNKPIIITKLKGFE